MTSEVNQHLLSKMFMSRAFRNGMTLAYWMEIEVSRTPLSFDSDLSKFIERVWASGGLEASIFIQYASVIPFQKALDIHILDNKCWLTSEVSGGHSRLNNFSNNFLTFFSGISCTGRSQRDLALAKETLLLPKKLCSCQRDFDLGKETLTLAKKLCSWPSLLSQGAISWLLLAKKPWSCQGDLALGKETLLLTRRSCSWQRNPALAQRNPALGKEILLLAKKSCSWQGDLALDKEKMLLQRILCFY